VRHKQGLAIGARDGVVDMAVMNGVGAKEKAR
jgi:hypothetical protein